MTRYSGVFEGRPFNVYMLDGRACSVAAEIGLALEYADGGRNLVEVIRKQWAEEMIEGRDFDVLTNAKLRQFKTILDVGEGSSLSRAPSLLVLYESGVDLVCLKTEKPLGKKLRRFMVDEVIPKLRRGEPILPATDIAAALTPISEAITTVSRAVESMTIIVAAQGRRLDAIEARAGAPAAPANDGTSIGAKDAQVILGRLRGVAAVKAGAIGQGGNAKATNRLRFIEERALRRELRFPMDRGCAWKKATPEQFGRAMLILERMDAEADDLARLAARDAGPLFRAVPNQKKTG